MRKSKNKSKKSLVKERFPDVDPAGLAPAWLRVNGNMLLYALRAQIHNFSITEKAPFARNLFRNTQLSS